MVVRRTRTFRSSTRWASARSRRPHRDRQASAAPFPTRHRQSIGFMPVGRRGQEWPLTTGKRSASARSDRRQQGQRHPGKIVARPDRRARHAHHHGRTVRAPGRIATAPRPRPPRPVKGRAVELIPGLRRSPGGPRANGRSSASARSDYRQPGQLRRREIVARPGDTARHGHQYPRTVLRRGVQRPRPPRRSRPATARPLNSSSPCAAIRRRPLADGGSSASARGDQRLGNQPHRSKSVARAHRAARHVDHHRRTV